MSAIVSPIDGTVITEVPDFDAEAVDAAMRCALAAQDDWCSIGPVERAVVLRRIAPECGLRSWPARTGWPRDCARERCGSTPSR
ncbi:aldehyde dehydrogenase family protein [Mycolicibacterium frederiksbergense]|uniref:aldehyde dehydrogenase family protein n=1 Tax=Mycolicibacterium frederiksbergense TaxID=117567 RepID=UPI003556E502